jgi:arylsulfatase A-like enzyme
MCSSKRRVLFPDSRYGIPASELTLAEALQAEGYATACIGKWHLGHLQPYLPLQNGFDYYFGIPYSNDMRPENPGAAKRGDPPLPLMEQNEVIEAGVDQHFLTPRYTEKATAFIRQHKSEPFFLYFPHTFPHIPLYASPAFEGKSRRGLYGDVVEELDWSVGEILKVLEEEGLAENTLVFFTSDNGPWLVMNERGGSAGLLREGKGCTWEGGMREPAIAWWPGTIPAGRVSTELATTMDLFPTSVKLAGGQLPDDRTYDGFDLLPVLKGEGRSEREEVVYYLGEEIYAYRKGPWKIHYKTLTPYRGQKAESHDPPLLYNLETDPSEQRNVAETHPEVVAALEAATEAHRATVERVPSQLEARIEKDE